MLLNNYAMVILDYGIKYKEIQKTIPCLQYQSLRINL